jgi:hypothetical protein
MAQGFQVTGRAEPDRRRIVFSIRGHIDSRVMIDRFIEIYSGVDSPWTYDRVFDYRRSDGLVEYPDVLRLADWWAGYIDPDCGRRRVAVIVNNPLDLVRARATGGLFPKDEVQSFLSLDDALSWLDEARE